MINKLYILIIILLPNISSSQNCDCMLQFSFVDTSLIKYIPDKTTRLEYASDSIFILTKGRTDVFEKFSFNNFKKFNRLRNDTFYVTNGNVYQKFGNKTNIVFSPWYFKKKKHTIEYAIIYNKYDYEPLNNNYEVHLYEYYPIEKIKIDKQNWFKDFPVSKVEINDIYFYKYLVKEYVYYAKFNQVDSNELFANISKIKKRRFISIKKVDSEADHDYYLYTIPGKLYIYHKYDKINFMIYNYIKTEGCDDLLKRVFKNWDE